MGPQFGAREKKGGYSVVPTVRSSISLPKRPCTLMKPQGQKLETARTYSNSTFCCLRPWSPQQIPSGSFSSEYCELTRQPAAFTVWSWEEN
ncbi:hypothetical protein E1301_Tti000421 [Triplophysa tibetana]|uniref:Uncharacterized protein n=1 Tax=Triplophysa tibetana TaxID=1572043 RepID=A0A5A9N463_9TELE|nr:hypothetical protein E1301_Tti000421 [Triplophysa tibetana]